MLGVKVGENIEENVYKNFPKEDLKSQREVAEKVFKFGISQTLEDVLNKDGKNIYVSTTFHPIIDKNSEVVSVIVTVRNNTEVMSLREELKKLKD